MSVWDHAQEHELQFWGSCQNTLGEELKQLVYAKYMGLTFYHDGNSPYNIDLQGKSVVDIGGGPVSLLLKCKNFLGVVIDPCPYPNWVVDRYKLAGIDYSRQTGENFSDIPKFDEVWIYNVLQHTEDPQKIIQNAKKSAKTLRIFEWIDNWTNEAHPISLTQELLDKWIGSKGNVIHLNENGAVGKAYYQICNIEQQ